MKKILINTLIRIKLNTLKSANFYTFVCSTLSITHKNIKIIIN
jgi:hypothetical protein